MGTWGPGSFDNDTAVDWTYELETADTLDPAERAFDDVLVLGDDEVGAEVGERAIAAAEVLARLKGHWGERNAYTETVDAWVGAHPALPSEPLVAKALAVLDRVIAPPSEMLALWGEAGNADRWLDEVKQLRSRIAS